MLDRKDSLLLIVDEQEKLVKALDKDIAVTRTSTLAKAARIIQIPTILTEQYPRGLGSTVEIIKQSIDTKSPIIEKSAFSAVKEKGFLEMLNSYGKKQIVICGIETHICVHQTTTDLIEAGFQVFVAKDACASRNKYEFKQGIERMQANGASISCVEIIIFEWLRSSKNPYFKEVQALIK